jgi:eukaryotic-like serine/threonine-protein kinase
MSLAPGTRLGSYEITASLGAGGMGEVYRATDLKLKRDVALKVLPPALADDRDRLARFQREAEVLASLNHPNIAQIYGLEETDDVRAIVMELVEGETLADIIKRGPIPVEAAIAYAKQIASAFEYAHDKPRPVIHRDLKPANVQVTAEGVVKVLDFGLAKALADEPPPSGSNPSNSPTLTMGPTVVGMILGTAAYMSPEQAKGKALDRRSDIWSFGVMLYEMVTGKRLFTGDDVAEILAAIVLQEPNLDAAPARLRPAIERCLRKEPRKRWYSMEDVRFALEEAPESGTASPVQAASLPHKRSKMPWAAAAVLLAGFAVVSFIHFRERAPEVAPIQAAILAPDNTDFDFNATNCPPALSPDGRRLVFGVRSGGKTQLWVRPLNLVTAQVLPGTEGASFPFWSPDSRSVGFFADGKLKRIDLAGGPPLTLADAPIGRGGAWNRDGVIVFSPGSLTPLMRVSAVGGTPVAATTLTTRSHRFPWFLPDGRHFLFEDQLVQGIGAVNIRIGSLDSKDVKLVGSATSNAIYAAGHLLFLREDTLMAQPFDPAKLATTVDAIPVANPVQRILGGGVVGLFSASGEGLLVYLTGDAAGTQQQLTWYGRDAKKAGTVGEVANFFQFRFLRTARILPRRVATKATTFGSTMLRTGSRHGLPLLPRQSEVRSGRRMDGVSFSPQASRGR